MVVPPPKVKKAPQVVAVVPVSKVTKVISPQLSKIVGADCARPEALKKVWEYIK